MNLAYERKKRKKLLISELQLLFNHSVETDGWKCTAHARRSSEACRNLPPVWTQVFPRVPLNEDGNRL